jgi:predicted HD phosphohydrolase
METVSFVTMADGTKEDYDLLVGAAQPEYDGLPGRTLDALRLLKNFGKGFKIDRYQHSLQTATRAERDGADEEMVVAALLHDLGDALAPTNHSEYAAAILEPYVSEKTHWVVRHHDLFQLYYFGQHIGRDRDARERYRDSPYFDATVEFCEKWDQTAFDPDYDTLPVEHFAPMVDSVFTRKPFATCPDLEGERRATAGIKQA